MKEELKKQTGHWIDLDRKAYQNNRFMFSDFLSEGELSDFLELPAHTFQSEVTLYGGFEEATRKMIRFGNATEWGYSEDFPITVLRISPLSKKFSEDLSHRDFLGALMNLGIERKLLGDLVLKENEAFLLCKDSIASFICQELTRVRHTTVQAKETADVEGDLEPDTEESTIVVSSLRLDLITAKLCNLSRKEMAKYLIDRKVFVNGKNTTNATYRVQDQDKISVRGFGKFQFVAVNYETKKGNLNITVRKYV
mgnify:CR=1 FL=1